MCRGASQVLAVPASRFLSQQGPAVVKHQEHAAFGCLDLPLTLHGLVLCKSSSSGGWGLLLSPAGGSGTDTFAVWLHSPVPATQKSLILGGRRGRGWESKQIFTSCKVTLSTRHRQRQNHGEHRMETICRADLPGATLPLKGAIALAVQGGGRAGCRATPVWQVPPLLPTPPSLSLLLSERHPCHGD